jgi:hypothetical protein
MRAADLAGQPAPLSQEPGAGAPRGRSTALDARAAAVMRVVPAGLPAPSRDAPKPTAAAASCPRTTCAASKRRASSSLRYGPIQAACAWRWARARAS